MTSEQDGMMMLRLFDERLPDCRSDCLRRSEVRFWRHSRPSRRSQGHPPRFHIVSKRYHAAKTRRRHWRSRRARSTVSKAKTP